MQNILVIFIFFLFSCACQNNKQDEDYPPKKTNTTQQDKIHLNNADVKRKKKIDKEIKNHEFSYYKVVDGEGDVMEYTIYYYDEEKTLPAYMRLIFKNGSFISLYKLSKTNYCLIENGINHYFENDQYIASDMKLKTQKLNEDEIQPILEQYKMIVQLING